MRKSSYAKIGAFVCAALLLAVAAAILMGAPAHRNKALLFETYLEETVQGVSEGADVKFRGIPIGSVRSVSFAIAKYRPDRTSPDYARASRYARIVFAIDADKVPNADHFSDIIDELISLGLRAHLKSQGITGLVYIDLNFDEPGGGQLPVPWEPEYKYIPAAPSLVKTLTDVMQGVVQEIHGLAEKGGEITNVAVRIGHLLDNADKALLSVDAAFTPLPGVLAGVSNMVAEATSLVREARTDAADLPALIAGATNLVGEASAFLASAKSGAEALAQSSSNLIAEADATLRDIRIPVQDFAAEASRVAKEVSETIQSVKNNSGRFLNPSSKEDAP